MADMETNIAYDVHGIAPTVENNTYEVVEVTPAPKKRCCSSPVKMAVKNIFITVVAATALLLILIFLTFFLVHYISYQPLETHQSAVIESMQSLLNSSNEQLQLQESELKEVQRLIQSLQLQLQWIEKELNNTQNLIEHIILRSCRDLPQGSPSGYYYIKSNNGIIQVYCDTNLRNCSFTGTTEWMRLFELDMTDPTQQCPDGFKLIDRTEPPLCTCGRPGGVSGCVSTTLNTHGIEYSRVCGRIVGYQIGSPNGFYYQSEGIDSYYVSGISLTHGQPRQHIYTFANAEGEGFTKVCPCIQGSTITVPQFVGADYFCDSAVRGSNVTEGVFYPNDPLWDGQGCGSTSTCCEFNNPPWFCKQLPQPTTDDIELRLCENGPPSYDDSPFEVVELYIG